MRKAERSDCDTNYERLRWPPECVSFFSFLFFLAAVGSGGCSGESQNLQSFHSCEKYR